MLSQLNKHFTLKKNYAFKQRFFSVPNCEIPSKAFIALLDFECRLNKEEPNVSQINYITEGLIHPSYYVFTSHLRSDLNTVVENKFQFFKKEMLDVLTKKHSPTQQEELVFTLKPGIFYIPYTTPEGTSALEKASDQQIADSRCLLGLPIYARKESEILVAIEEYCRLLRFDNFSEMQRLIPHGVVVYAANNHDRAIEELRTLQYLEECTTNNVSLWEIGYVDVYKKFIEPKLITSEGLVKPQDFNVNLLTASYSNRLFDKLMGMIYEVVTEQGGNPTLYLKQCYGFHLIANPYNFTSQWLEASDWRSEVIKHVSSDIIWNFCDVATRINPEHELLLCRFRKFGDNVVNLKNTNRQATIIIPEITVNYEDLSNSQIAATVLGHSLSAAIDSLYGQEPQIPQRLRAYLTNQITKHELDVQRQAAPYCYNFDPLVGIPLNHLLNREDISFESIWVKPIISSQFIFDLYAMVIYDLQPIEESYYISRRYIDIYMELSEEGHSLPIGETFFDFKFLDFLIMSDPDIQRVLKLIFVELYLVKAIDQVLKIHPDKKQVLQKFFTTLCDRTDLWRLPDDDKATWLQSLVTLNSGKHYSRAYYLIAQAIPDEKIIKPYLKELPTELSLRADFFLLKQNLTNIAKITEEKLEQQITEKEKLIKLNAQRCEIVGFSPEFLNKFKKISIETNEDFIEGAKVLWECIGEASSKLLHSGEISPVYCVLLRDLFTYTVCLKLRAANQSYTNYLRNFSEKNKFKPEQEKMKPMAFNKIILSHDTAPVIIPKFKIVNEISQKTMKNNAISEQNTNNLLNPRF